MSPCDHVYMYGGSYENIDFHVKHIAKTNSLVWRCDKSEKTMNVHEKNYIVIAKTKACQNQIRISVQMRAHGKQFWY